MNFEVLPLGMLLQSLDHLGREMYNFEQQRRKVTGGIVNRVDLLTNPTRPILPLHPGKDQLFPAPALAEQYLSVAQLEGIVVFWSHICNYHMVVSAIQIVLKLALK